MNKINILITSIILLIAINDALPCTTAIISGKFTSDGRPLLWKNRDADEVNNKLMYFTDGKYTYIGLVNSNDITGNEVWIGMNSAGFAIMNSASYNLKMNDTTKLSDREGIIIKMALQQCASLEDFENMMNSLPKQWGLEANFGIIDANGGGAYYETSNRNFKKFDVNDINSAPRGYLLRTNFSFSGETDKGQGYERYDMAEELFSDASSKSNLSYQFILKEGARCLKHGLTKVDLSNEISDNAENVKFVSFTDFIPRYSTSASIVIQGVKVNQPANLMTMWTVLGFPLCSVVYPVWLNDRHELPSLLKADETGKARLCSMALQLKDKCFPVIRGRGTNYININALINKDNSGIYQKLQLTEADIFSISGKFISKMINGKTSSEDIIKFYNDMDEKISATFIKMK